MPIYEYACGDCGEHFDKLQKIDAPAPANCPCCGKAGCISRAPTAPAIRLAGTGWYETDFKSKTEKRRNLAGDSSPSPPKTTKATP